jgi:RNA polymerase sigma-70 factor (ECF subfamily)
MEEMGQMDETPEHEWMAEQFEANRAHLKAVAYRMLGSLSEADDAVQEAWLRFSRADTGSVQNLAGWLTTVVAHVCLDMLRSRNWRREEPMDIRAQSFVPRRYRLPDPVVSLASSERGMDPEHEALLADSVGLALLVVLETLAPAARLAFVLHDMFGVPFEEIAPIVGRSAAAARQLASRARRRVRGAKAGPDADLAYQREVVDAFFAAARGGDFEALLRVLDPEAVVRADYSPGRSGTLGATATTASREVRGAKEVARQALTFSRLAEVVQPALVNGAAGMVAWSGGHLYSVMSFIIRNGKIVEIDVIADSERLGRIEQRLLGVDPRVWCENLIRS